MASPEDYKKIITELVQKQMVVLGPNIALDEARKIAGLKVAQDGSVMEMSGDGTMVLKAISNAYISLSSEVSKKILASVLSKYSGNKPV